MLVYFFKGLRKESFSVKQGTDYCEISLIWLIGVNKKPRHCDKFLYLKKPLMMESIVTDGVRISVEQFYQADYSNPVQGEFMFAYRIIIENNNSFPVQLLRRHWHIHDSNSEQREVEGEGVIGVQPIIAPAQQYQYISGCNLKSELGQMYGTYLMENVHTKAKFEVKIPVFQMEAPFKRN
jgi:ApaG protein